MKKANIIVSFITAGIGILVLYLSKDYPDIVYGTKGPGYWPSILAWILIILSVLIHIEYKMDKQNEQIDFKSDGVKIVYLIMGLCLIYFLLMYFLGFIISSILIVPLIMIILREKKFKYIIIFSILFISFVYILFEFILKSGVPHPIWTM